MRIRRLFIVLPGLLALLAAAACTTAPSVPRVPSGASPSTTHQARPASRAVRASGEASSVTLAFAGDVHFTGRTARLLSDPATAFGPVAAVLRSADFAAVNLETSVSSHGVPQPKTYHFRTTLTVGTGSLVSGDQTVTTDALAGPLPVATLAAMTAIGNTARLRNRLRIWPPRPF